MPHPNPCHPACSMTSAVSITRRANDKACCGHQGWRRIKAISPSPRPSVWTKWHFQSPFPGQLSPSFFLWQMKMERSNPSSKWEGKTQAGSNLVVQVNIWVPSQCLSEISPLCLRFVSISHLIALIYSPLSRVPCCLLTFLPPLPCFFYSMLCSQRLP